MPRPAKVPTPPPPGYVWTPEAARLTGLSIKTLWNYSTQGKGPKVARIGRKLAYPIAELEAWRDAELNPEPDAQAIHASRPAEPRLARRKAARAA
ncbi:helix-turn-helix transcriptional regulator [Streptomyces sp. BH104]|uniref:helix-turn-helix transcriptional regulator n=1 Tax=Streptomyces sp. BH104 TaxID=3410407 RepID=UPI003BB607D5